MVLIPVDRPSRAPPDHWQSNLFSGMLVVMTTMAATQQPQAGICPSGSTSTVRTTGLPVDTGHELTEIRRLAPQPQMLIDCIVCGEDHAWRIEDAFSSSAGTPTSGRCGGQQADRAFA
jgi:hypothetical protein